MMIFTKFERTCSEEEETQCNKKVIEHADGRRTNSAQVSFNGNDSVYNVISKCCKNMTCKWRESVLYHRAV